MNNEGKNNKQFVRKLTETFTEGITALRSWDHNLQLPLRWRGPGIQPQPPGCSQQGMGHEKALNYPLPAPFEECMPYITATAKPIQDTAH